MFSFLPTRVLRVCSFLFLMSAAVGVSAQTRGYKIASATLVDPAAVSAPFTDKIVPSTFVVPISLNNTSGTSVTSFQFNIQYDPTVIDPTGANFGCSTSGTLAETAGLFAICNVTPDGLLRVSVFGAGTINGSGTVLNVLFKTDTAAIPGQFSPLSFQDVFVFNNSGLLSTTGVNGRVNLQIPTGTSSNVVGRVKTSAGLPIKNAQVLLQGANGFEQRAISNGLGFFTFSDVPTGTTYVISASAKRFQFPAQLLDIASENTTTEIVAEN